VKTLILANMPRMQTLGIATPVESAALTTKLQELANHPRVQGLVVDLAGVTSLASLYTAWDSDPGSPDKANTLLFGTGGIQEYLRTQLLPAYTGVEYLVLVGDDRIIPFARIHDDTALLPESTYITGGNLTATGTTVGRALAANRFLSDDPLGNIKPVSVGDMSGVLLVPDLAIGRLVEKPSEITSTISTFISQDGVLDLTALDPSNGHKVLITGYDFLTSSGKRIRDRWKSWFGATAPDNSLSPVDGSLVSTDWGITGPSAVPDRITALRTHLGGNGGARYGVMGLFGHAAHYEEGVPGTSPTDIQGLSTADIFGLDSCATPTLGALDLAGAFIYAAGCHSGLPVPGSCRTDPEHSLDLPQTFLSRGVVSYLGNTGYGWALMYGVGYITRLTELFTQEMTTSETATTGLSALRAKQKYFLESPRFDAYDQKTLMQWTLFGLPMYVVKTTTTPPALPAKSDKETIGTIQVDRRLEPAGNMPTFLTQLTLHFDLSAQGVFEKHDADGNVVAGVGCPTAAGCYYTLNGLVDRGLGDLPLLPYLVYDSRLSGTSQHGVLWKGGSYVEESGFTPIMSTLVSNGAPNTDHGSLPRQALIPPTSTRLVPGQDSATCRPVDQELNSLTATAAEVAKVNDTDARSWPVPQPHRHHHRLGDPGQRPERSLESRGRLHRQHRGRIRKRTVDPGRPDR
jgi:hypothetical protein